MANSEKMGELFEKFLHLPAEQRPEYIEKVCGADTALRAEFQKLIETEQTRDLLEKDGLHNTASTAALALPQSGGKRTSFYIGELVSKRFLITRFLGQGGMGQVYEAKDTVLGGSVALKTIRPEIANLGKSFERFKQEVRLAKQVTDENVCRVFDLDNHNIPPFITMELVDGETLSSRLRREGRMTISDALPLVEQMAHALAAAHQKGIIHRDFKPGNVMLARSNSAAPHIKVTDFGLARSIDGDRSLAPGIIGTPEYMAPEQLEGRHATIASDIYALGLVIYEMVVGTKPDFHPLTQKPPSPRIACPDLDEKWEKTILRCLERDPARRFAHVGEIAAAIGGNAGISKRRGRSIRRYSLSLMAAGIAFLLAISVRQFLLSSLPQSENTVLTEVTSDSGLATYPTVSPDGSLIAYASDRAAEGNLNIWLQQLGGGDPIRLTKDASDEYAPTFSHDGTEIAFRSERVGGGIYSVPTLGGTPRLLVAGGFGPRFSPDGKWMSYWVGAPGSGFVPGSSQIYLKPSTGGPAKPFHPEFAADFSPVWSPDGTQLLFVGRQDPRPGGEKTLDWWVAAIDGGSARRTGAMALLERYQLKAPVGQDKIIPTAWVPAGNRVLFSAALGDSTNVWDIPISIESGQIAGPPRQLTSGTGVELHASPVPGLKVNSRLCYSSEALKVDVWELPLDTATGRVLGSMRRLTQGLSYAASPSLSADGSKLTFTASRSGRWSIRTRDLDTGKDFVQVSANQSWLRARISADGTKVAYVENNDSMYVSDLSNGTSEKICEHCGPPTDISPDAKTVLFEPLGPPENVMKIDLAQHHIGDMVEHPSHPDWILYAGRFSPDGNWIAFHVSVDRSLNKKIFIARVRDGHALPEESWIPVTSGNAIDWHVSWSPDGNLLYFLSDRDGFRCIWAQHLNAISKRPVGRPFAVQHFHHSRHSLMRLGRGDVIGLAVARGKMVFALGELSGNVWLDESKGTYETWLSRFMKSASR